MLKWILFAVITITIVVVSTGYSMSRPLALRGDGLLRNPPSCEMNGKRVYYHKVSQEEMWKQGAGLAMATIDHGLTPWIVIDGDNMKKFSAPFQYWMLRHECWHHMAAHTKINIQSAMTKGGEFERISDCGAIDDMVKSGFTDEQFEQLFADMANRDMIFNAIRGIRMTEYSNKNHKWTPEERMEYNKQCLITSRSKYLEKKPAPTADMTQK